MNLILGLALLVTPASARSQKCDRPSAARAGAIVAGLATAETVMLLSRAGDWWTTPTTRFHFARGPSANGGQDRLLHAAIGYHTSQIGALAWDWACVSHTLAGWLGAALGLAIGLPKEIGDGLHEDKGFVTTDVLAGAAGALLPALHRTWTPSRAISLKGNYWPSNEFRNRIGALPQLENDYAGQRYYLAINPGLLPGGAGPWPDWLGLAVGHSIQHWITARPVEQWYATLDFNFRALPIRAAWWRRVATVIDQVHLPFLGVRFSGGTVTVGLF